MVAKYNLTLLDIMVLLYHVQRGAETSAVGFEDCERTLEELTAVLTANFARIPLKESVVESALWSCNLMYEHGEFWSPEGCFKNWLTRFCEEHGVDFDMFFNTLKPKIKKG